MNINKKIFGLPIQKAFSLYMALYLFISSAFPLIMLQPVRAEEPTDNNSFSSLSTDNLVPPTLPPVTPFDPEPVLLGIPVNLGWNVANESSTPNETPLDRVCVDGVISYVNINSVAMNWSSIEGEDVKYQREVIYPSGSVGFFYANTNYTPFSVFGSSTGIEGLWKTRVRSYIDSNSNNVLDTEETYSDWSNQCQIKLDLTKPTAPVITQPTADYFNSSPIYNEWTVSTDDSGIDYYRIEYQYDDGHSFSGAPYRTSETNYRYHSPSINEQGGVQFRVQAFDNAGNESDWSDWEHYFYDQTAPAKPTGLVFNNVARTETYQCGVFLSSRVPVIPNWDDYDVVADPSFSHYEYTSFWPDGSIGLNEIVLNVSELDNNWAPPMDGAYGYAVRTVDKAGNKSEWTPVSKTLEGSCQVIYDSEAPDVEITSPTSNSVSKTIEIRGSVNDANPWRYWLVIENSSGVKVAGPGVVYDSNTFTDKFFFNWDTTTLPDGAYTIKLEARDQASNKDSGSYHWLVVNIDNTAPILNLPENIWQEALSASGNNVEFEVSAYDDYEGIIPIYCDYNSGDLFAMGVTVVTCTATDSLGNTNTGMFSITIEDTIAPELTVPADRVREATGPDGRKVYFQAAVSAIDNIDGELPVSCSPQSGSTFPLGETTVYCTAVDSSGNDTTKTFKVTIVDTSKPVFENLTNIKLEATGPDGAIATYTIYANDIVDGRLEATCTPESGNIFPLGLTKVRCEVSDKAGNTARGSFFVIVKDTTPPVFDEYRPFIIREATGPDGAKVKFSLSATDIVDESVDVYCLPKSGSVFPIGKTWVTCIAYDDYMNWSVAFFLVIVKDTTPPVVTVPENQVFEADSPLGYLWSFNPSASDIVDGNNLLVDCRFSTGDAEGDGELIPLNQEIESQVSIIIPNYYEYQFPLGDTLVTCTATDRKGNTGDASFIVTVEDTTDPVLSVNPDIIVDETGINGALVTFTNPTATDIVDQELDVNCEPASGQFFPQGETIVECSATDDSGNTGTSSFKVTVLNVVPNASITTNLNGDRSYNFTAGATGGNAPYTYTWSGGNFGNCTGNASTIVTPNVAGTYTCTLTVTDVDGDTDTETSSVTVTAVQTQRTGNVVAATTNVTTTPTVEPTLEPEAQILGLRTCEDSERKLLKVIVFVDSNSNGEKDENESVVPNVKVELYYNNEGEKVSIGTFTSDNEGVVEIYTCAGEYKLEIDTQTLPSNTNIEENTIDVKVLSDSDETSIGISLNEEVNNDNSSILILMLVLVLGGVLLYIASKRGQN